jgi:hypothetical protein
MPTAFPKLLYDNRLADGALVASSTAAGYAVGNLRDWRPYTWWKPASLPVTVTVDCGSARSADYFAVYGHDLFTRGCTVECRRSTDNFVANDVLVASRTPTDDKPFVVEFASASSRYWRLNITGSAAPVLAIAPIGAALVMPRRLNLGFDPTQRRVQGQVNRSEDGHPLGRVIHFEQWDQELSFGQISWSWIRGTWLPAWKAHLRGRPFLFGWDLTDNPGEVYLVQAGDGFDTPTVLGPYTDLRFRLTGVAP